MVAGFGRTGRAVVDALRRADIPSAVIDLHHETVTRAIDEGVPAVWGDVGHEDILRAAGILHSRMLVLAVSDWKSISLGIARAVAATHVAALRRLRVDAVVQPEFEGGVEIVRRALTHLDRDDEEIDDLTGELRRTLYEPDPSTRP